MVCCGSPRCVGLACAGGFARTPCSSRRDAGYLYGKSDVAPGRVLLWGSISWGRAQVEKEVFEVRAAMGAGTGVARGGVGLGLGRWGELEGS